MTTRDVLRLREFRLLFAGHGVSVFGDRMVAVALAFAVLELGGSASEVGLVLAASWVPAVATVLVGGVISDRVSRQTVMVAADLLRVASQGVMAALLTRSASRSGDRWPVRSASTRRCGSPQVSFSRRWLRCSRFRTFADSRRTRAQTPVA